MPASPPDLKPASGRGIVLRLLVRNHPDVMSHVCGLFARRAFNVEGILCMPIDDGARSVVLLLVHEDDRIGFDAYIRTKAVHADRFRRRDRFRFVAAAEHNLGASVSQLLCDFESDS